MRKAELSSHRKDLTTATIGNSTIVSVQEEAMSKDCTAKLNDALASFFSKWWILELLPQRHAWQETDGNWNKGW